MGRWYNPSALYAPSADVSKAMDETRKKILHSLGAYDGQVVFTSGGTESNNMAILSAVPNRKAGHFITSAYEHAAVYKTFKHLEQMGHEVGFIPPNRDGVISEEDVVNSIKENTVLVSIMHVNNETGAINDIDGISSLVKAKNKDILFHSDGVQGFLKTPYVISENIDFYSVSGHKIGALKGTGALYSKKGITHKQMLFGGSQEAGNRPGTENTFGIAVFGEAIKSFDRDNKNIFDLRNRLVEGLENIEDVVINSPKVEGKFSPYIVNASVLGVKGETLLHALESKGIYIGIGSACSSKTKTSRIHDALGLSAERAQSAVRISFSHDNTAEQIDRLLSEIESEAKDLRMFKRR